VRTAVVLLAVLGLGRADGLPRYYRISTPNSLSLLPDAASVALAGALAGAGPGIAASVINPAASAGLKQTEIALSYGPWLADAAPGRSHTWIGACLPAGRFAVGIAASLTPRGDHSVYDRYGRFIDRFAARDATVGAGAAFALTGQLSAGLGLKLYASNATENYRMWPLEAYPLRATALAPLLDVGVRWDPHPRVELGLSLCDAGPDIDYTLDSLEAPVRRAVAAAPWTTRLGGRIRIVGAEPIRLDLLGQVSRTGPNGRISESPEGNLRAVRRETVCSVAVDALAGKIFAVRLGYLDYTNSGRRGLALGTGFWLADLLRIDLSLNTETQAGAWPTSDWCLSLTSYRLERLWHQD
jgi:hypothetical protein